MTAESKNSKQEKMRLNKAMALKGLCSRREADEYIAKGLVRVDGEIVRELGVKVYPTQHIELVEKAQKKQSEKATIILNKPVGYVSGQPEDDHKPAVVLITKENQFLGEEKLKREHFDGLAPAGRLDIDSRGLIVFTQNGTIAKQLIGEDSNIEKEYLVRVSGTVTPEIIKKLEFGLHLDGKPLKRARIKQTREDFLVFVLTEGKKRQIRRMCELVGLQVLSLLRLRIGNVLLDDLPEGKWRFLTPEEKF
ncbi:MAG: pseudouridine synthase [Bdellovibrionota bacterium]